MTPHEIECLQEEYREQQNRHLAEDYDDGLADGWSGEPPCYPENDSYMQGWRQGAILKETSQQAKDYFGLPTYTEDEEF